MQTRTFGRTGREVTEVGLGAWPIGQKPAADGGESGSYGRVDPKDAVRVLERYVELGGSFIDTARAYGSSESLVGRCSFMRDRRESVFIATKSHHTGSAEALDRIEDDLHTSLRELNTDYVDLYQIHSPPEDEELIRRVIDVFLRLKQSGKVLAIGASIRGPNVTPEIVALSKRYVDTGAIDALQLIYSAFRRAHEETFAYAARRGVAIIARTVMESGFLTGKYRPGDEFTGHRSRWSASRRARLIDAASGLARLVAPPYASLAQAAQKFALSRPEVSVIIPGARTVSQVEANCEVASLPPLPAPLLDAIDALPPGIAELANPGD